MAVKPVTFDFAVFLAIAEMYRKQHSYDGYVVLFVPGPNDGLRAEVDSYEGVVPLASRKWRFSHILMPMLDFAPHCLGHYVAETRRAAAEYLSSRNLSTFPLNYDVAYPATVPRNAWRAYLTPENTPRVFSATSQAIGYVKQWLGGRGLNVSKLISVTIRDYGYGNDRNSNLSEWYRFADYVMGKGYDVVFIPDVENAMLSPVNKDYVVFDQASWNLHLRVALYQISYLNMFVNAGPAALCYLSEAPYIMAKIITENVGQSSKESLEDQGYSYLCTPEFATYKQLWAWHDDCFTNLKATFEQYVIERSKRGE